MLDTGIHRITSEEYHADNLCPEPSLSRSTIADLVNRTAAHAKFCHPRLNPNLVREDKAAFDIGTAAHSLFLEGIDNCVIVDADSWRTKDAKEARDEAYAAGKTPLLANQYEKVQGMVEAAHGALAASELAIMDLHSAGESELSYIWQEAAPNTGKVYCRVRPDWISNEKIANGGKRKLILDLKTCESANPDAFIKKAAALGYLIQAHFYCRGVQATEGGELPRFIFMLVETSEPHLCSFVELDAHLQDIGKQQTEYGIYLWQKCLSENSWPGYDKRVATLECPGWIDAQWEATASRIGE